MGTLIDGYNLLHATGFLGRNLGRGTLARARLALLKFLAVALSETERPTTTVVFDAHEAPRGVPSTENYRGITVRYAVGYDDADALVEELIRRDSAPRSLVVVSSDRHIQRTAKRRRALAVDSEAWYDQLCERRKRKPRPEASDETKPLVPLTDAELAEWLRDFGENTQDLTSAPPAAAPPSPSDSIPTQPIVTDPELLDPFPPGYAEDLFKEE
ncbi:MAG: NYN domain-containing protein [Pirellulaceae bacterium]